jgi:Xaa-Pro aminopeptidase
MFQTRAAIALLLLGVCAAAQQIPQEEFKKRREALRKSFGGAYTARDHGRILFIAWGATERGGGDIRTGFFQEPNFYYLTGWKEPGAVLVMTPTDDILLLPSRNPQQERWTGKKSAPGDAGLAETTGFPTVLPVESLESKLAAWLAEASTLYTLGSQREVLQKLAPAREIADARQHIARLRAVKSEAEIAAIQKATDATMGAHRAAWSKIKPGLMEYEVAGVMSGSYFGGGCERHAYAPIVGSGPNAAVLHYSVNSRRMDAGELLLMDVGAECGMYASDITRTVPVNGKFTARQRELYDVVLGAQKAAIAAIKPGMTISRQGDNSIHTIAFKYIDTHGKDLKGQPLGQYFIHGLSHHVGLDVHDANDPAVPLAPGMVITVEPGVYIPDEGIGIRIEDVVLVTETGAKLLSSSLPREADEIEKALARN